MKEKIKKIIKAFFSYCKERAQDVEKLIVETNAYEPDCPFCGCNIIKDPFTPINNHYLNHLNILRDKVHKNAVNKGFYECKECNGTGKDPFNVMGTGDGNCTSCRGTGKVLDKNFGELLMLITSELGEALEADRKGIVADVEGYKAHLDYCKVDFHAEQFSGDIKDSKEDELADALIRILDTCGYLGIDIQWHVEHKMKYNEGREVKHGKRY